MALRRLAVNLQGRILVAREKHATRYFDASTEEALFAAALKLLRERMNPSYGYIRAPGKAAGWYKSADILTDEQIAALPNDALKAQADKARRDARSMKNQYEEALVMWGMAQAARENKDGRAAWQVLQMREDYEYEGVRFEYMEKTP
jgi:hypothetical protein